MKTASNASVSSVVEQLRNRIRQLEPSRRGPCEGGPGEGYPGEGSLATGWPPLDALMPGGGLRRGSLVEWLAAGPGSGAALLAWATAQAAALEGGAIVVLDRQRTVYPPALAGWGADLERVIFVQPQNARDEGWAWDQALRCPGVAAVWGWVERIDSRLFRRWQLAAETSGCVGLLVRPGHVRNQPTWADVRWWVEPQSAAAGRRMRVELLRCRGAGGTRSVELVLDEWTGQLCDSAMQAGLAMQVGTGINHPVQHHPDHNRFRFQSAGFRSETEEEPRHVTTHPRPLAAQLARATARPRPAGTGDVRSRAV